MQVMDGMVGEVSVEVGVEEEAGLVHGQVEDLSVTCRHGRGQDGIMVEEHVGGF